MKSTAIEQFLVIDGDSLREVYHHISLDEYEPGMNGPAEEHTKTTETVRVASRGAGRVPDLVVTTQTDNEKPERKTLSWNGKAFGYKPAALPTPAAVIDPASPKSIEPVLAKIFGGTLLSATDLKELSPAAINLLRNAVFARHGRAFQRPDLQAFFYGPRPTARASTLLPRRVDPRFKDSMLDAVDKQNLTVLQTADKTARKR